MSCKHRKKRNAGRKQRSSKDRPKRPKRGKNSRKMRLLPGKFTAQAADLVRRLQSPLCSKLLKSRLRLAVSNGSKRRKSAAKNSGKND